LPEIEAQNRAGRVIAELRVEVRRLWALTDDEAKARVGELRRQLEEACENTVLAAELG
jgi:hypothetical protein